MFAIAITLPDGTKVAVVVKPPVKAGLSQRPSIDVQSEPAAQSQKVEAA
jgi:hypothetical protein